MRLMMRRVVSTFTVSTTGLGMVSMTGIGAGWTAWRWACANRHRPESRRLVRAFLNSVVLRGYRVTGANLSHTTGKPYPELAIITKIKNLPRNGEVLPKSTAYEQIL